MKRIALTAITAIAIMAGTTTGAEAAVGDGLPALGCHVGYSTWKPRFKPHRCNQWDSRSEQDHDVRLGVRGILVVDHWREWTPNHAVAIARIKAAYSWYGERRWTHGQRRRVIFYNPAWLGPNHTNGAYSLVKITGGPNGNAYPNYGRLPTAFDLWPQY